MNVKKRAYHFIVFIVSVGLFSFYAVHSLVGSDFDCGYGNTLSSSAIIKYQGPGSKNTDSEKADQGAKSHGGIKTFLNKHQVRAGLLPGMSFPVGELGGLIKVGFAGNIFSDLAVPISFLKSRGLYLRSGLSIGYAPFGSAVSEYDAKISLLPLLAYAELAYPLQVGIKPFVRFGTGGTFSSLKDKSENPGASDESSFDYTLALGAGASYQHRAIPRVEFLLNLGYMILFEEVNGNFINISIGACYHLYR
jgi:opacity protein-like surface antigen